MFACCAASVTCAAAFAGGGASAHLCKSRALDAPGAASLRAAAGAAAETFPVEMEADAIDATPAAYRLSGSAHMRQGARALFAGEIFYERAARKFSAEGGVTLHTARGDMLRAARMQLDADFHGVIDDAELHIAEPRDGEIFLRARADARRIAFLNADRQELHDVRMSSCVYDELPLAQKDVQLRAKQVTLDHERGFGSARAMSVWFKNVPLMYFPRVTFPIDDRRKTGFLFPAAGYADESGMLIETPFYLNLAPHYDATITPRVMSGRGAQLAAQFRYLSARARGELHAEGISSDRQYRHLGRHALSYRHRHTFANWHAAFDLQTFSDSDYAGDFRSGTVLAKSYAARNAHVAYRAKYFQLDARAAAYDAAAPSVTYQPHAVLPQVRFALQLPRLRGFSFDAEGEYARFAHAENLTEGTRRKIAPRMRIHWRRAHAYVTPSASLHSIRYSLTNSDSDSDSMQNASADVPVYSVDSGLFFRRNIARGGGYLQTFEPRMRYLRVPLERAQENFPNFDGARRGATSIAHYFRDNRFSGGGRIGDTEQLTLALGGRVLRGADGMQIARMQLGKVFYFRERELPPEGNIESEDAETHDASGLLMEGEITARATHLNVFARADENDRRLDALRLDASYAGARRRASVGYRIERGAQNADAQSDDEQIRASFDTPLGALRELHAAWAYSLEERATQSAKVQIRFDGCCWAVRAGVQRYLDGDGGRKTRALFTLELDDLGRVSLQ